jgi:hypothetical protein
MPISTKETGETYYVSTLGDSDELPDDLDENEKYINIPHKNDLDLGRNLVFNFISTNLPGELETRQRNFPQKRSLCSQQGLARI